MEKAFSDFLHVIMLETIQQRGRKQRASWAMREVPNQPGGKAIS